MENEPLLHQAVKELMRQAWFNANTYPSFVDYWNDLGNKTMKDILADYDTGE